MYINLKLFNFFLIKTKFTFYFYNFSSIFFLKLPFLKKIELLLPFKKKYKFIFNVLLFLSMNLLCSQRPCYKLINNIGVWKKGKRFNVMDIKVKHLYLTLRSSSIYSFLDCLVRIYIKKNIFINHFCYEKKKLEDLFFYTTNISLVNVHKKITNLVDRNQIEYYSFLNNISTSTLSSFSFVFFFNLLDFPLIFTFFNLIHTLINFKFYIILLAVLKLHSLFFLKFLNLLV